MSTRNKVLLAIPEPLRQEIIGASTLSDIPLAETLYETGRQPHDVVFPESGIASVVTPLADGAMVEAGIIGFDGYVGTSVLLGEPSRTTRVVWQVPGSARRLPRKEFVKLIGATPHPAFYRAAQALSDQFAQVTACNRRHSIRQRAARWLLMVADRGSDERIELTHEFLATMLGAGRPKVTLAAQQLQNDKLINYRRGLISITDRPGLTVAACECYAALARSFPGR